MGEKLPISAVVTDIEGTTNDIAFVKETLFPYAAQALPSFVAAYADDETVAAQLAAVAKEIGCTNRQAIIEQLLSWIEQDEGDTIKTTARPDLARRL